MTPIEIFQVFVLALVGALPLFVTVAILWKNNRENRHENSSVVFPVPLRKSWIVVENPGKDICLGEIKFPKELPRIAVVN